jgi:hypothetical protein
MHHNWTAWSPWPFSIIKNKFCEKPVSLISLDFLTLMIGFALILVVVAVAAQQWPIASTESVQTSWPTMADQELFNREFQVRLNATALMPLMANGWSQLLAHLRLVNEQCGTACHISIPSMADIQSHYEVFHVLDTSDNDFQSHGFVLTVRDNLDARASFLTLKFNNLNADVVMESPIKVRKQWNGPSKSKLEMDIYPCRQKYAKSLKVELPLFNETHRFSFRQLQKVYGKLRKAMMDVDDMDSKSVQDARPPTVRWITELPVRIGYTDEDGGNAVMISTSLALTATYANVEDAMNPMITPSLVEWSFRYPAKSARRLLSSDEDRAAMLKAFWKIYRGIISFPNVLERDCV